MPKSWPVWTASILAVVCLGVWAATLILGWFTFPTRPDAGTFGDAFAPVTALFSALGMIAAIASFNLQRQENEEQRKSSDEGRRAADTHVKALAVALQQLAMQARATQTTNRLAFEEGLYQRRNDVRGARARAREVAEQYRVANEIVDEPGDIVEMVLAAIRAKDLQAELGRIASKYGSTDWDILVQTVSHLYLCIGYFESYQEQLRGVVYSPK